MQRKNIFFWNSWFKRRYIWILNFPGRNVHAHKRGKNAEKSLTWPRRDKKYWPSLHVCVCVWENKLKQRVSFLKEEISFDNYECPMCSCDMGQHSVSSRVSLIKFNPYRWEWWSTRKLKVMSLVQIIIITIIKERYSKSWEKWVNERS